MIDVLQLAVKATLTNSGSQTGVSVTRVSISW